MNPIFLFAACTKNFLFFLPTWWEYLKTGSDALGQCVIDFNFPKDVLPVGLAILDILLRLAGFLAVVSIMLAGAAHLFSGGDAQKAATARHRIFTSVIGLIIALTATAAVTFVGNQVGGSGSVTTQAIAIQANIPKTGSDTLKIVLNDFFAVMGAIAFLVLIIGGFQYINSRSTPEKITQAKNIIMYALVGLIIIALASTITNVVLGRVG